MKSPIKKINDETVEQIVEIHQEVFGKNGANLDFKTVATMLSTGVLFFVEFDDSKNVACFCTVVSILDEWEIHDLVTAPQYRNRGFAKKLLDDLLIYAKENSAKKIFLEVREENHPAINLYKKCGFEQYMIRKNYYKNSKGEFSSAICMMKNL